MNHKKEYHGSVKVIISRLTERWLRRVVSYMWRPDYNLAFSLEKPQVGGEESPCCVPAPHKVTKIYLVFCDS